MVENYPKDRRWQSRQATRIARSHRPTLEPLETRLVLAAPTVVEVDPLPNIHTAPVQTDIKLIYDQDIDPATVSDQTLSVHAQQTGRLLVPPNTHDVTENTVLLSPIESFRPGELVEVTATADIANLEGVGAEDPFVRQFRTAVGSGSGFFANSGQGLGDSQSVDVALGDVDSDGDLDAFVANAFDPNANRVWLNEEGLFSDSGQSLGNSDSFSVALGDLDNDGDLDAFVGNLSSSPDEGSPNKVWLNEGGIFSDSGQNLGSSDTRAVALADLDGDGDLDALVGNTDVNSEIWFNDGEGNFNDSGQSLGSLLAPAMAVGDVDSDGDLDAILQDKVWINDGSGTLTDSDQNLGNPFAAGVELADLDGDDHLDAFFANFEPADQRTNQVLLNDGLGNFSNSGQRLGSSLSLAVALGDLDADGDLDAFVANLDPIGGNSNRVWLNDGSGQFSQNGQRLEDSSGVGVALGDVDADGDLDAFVALANQVWLNLDHIPGDMNLDGMVDFDDNGPFSLGLKQPSGYEITFDVPPAFNGDTNDDGRMDFDDIPGYVAILVDSSLSAGAQVSQVAVSAFNMNTSSAVDTSSQDQRSFALSAETLSGERRPAVNRQRVSPKVFRGTAHIERRALTEGELTAVWSKGCIWLGRQEWGLVDGKLHLSDGAAQ